MGGGGRNANSPVPIGHAFGRGLAAALGRPVRVGNDANCFALAEAMAGAGQGAQTVFGVILGTGIGGGIVVDGRVLAGRTLIAGEWGHTRRPAAGALRPDTATGATNGHASTEPGSRTTVVGGQLGHFVPR